ncbi:AraC family transcriptional regulator [soil metagenome]
MIEGVETPILLGSGDVFLLAMQRGFILSSDPTVPPRDAVAMYPAEGQTVIQLGEGDDFLFLGGHVDVSSASGQMLVETLPQTRHLKPGCSEAAALEQLIEQLVREHGKRRPGADFALTQLAQLIFLQILRAVVADAEMADSSWLRAISDPRIESAMRLMHGDPSRNWHLPELAKAAGMSRTAFAVRFKAVSGMAPLTYMTQWRMYLAKRQLRQSVMPVSLLGRTLGYASETAFSTAFKRVTGEAPKRYRAQQRREDGRKPP